MPYTHKKVGNKYVVYKHGKKVGSTEGTKAALDKYLAALHINADKKESVKESITMEQPTEETHMMEHEHPGCEDKVGQICVVLRPSPESSPEDLVHPTHAFGMGQFDPSTIHGIYNDEKEANLVAEAICSELQQHLAEVEEKKTMVTEKIDKAIKDLQKEVNRCMDEGRDGEALQILERIAMLREKHKMVEASKKPLEEKESDSKKKVDEGVFDRIKAQVKGSAAAGATHVKNVGNWITGKEKQDPTTARNMAMLRQKAKTLDKELVDVMNDISKLFPAGTMTGVPAEFKSLLYNYLITLEKVKKINASFITGNVPTTTIGSQPSHPTSTAPATNTTQKPAEPTQTAEPKQAQQPATQEPAVQGDSKQALSYDLKKYTVDSKGRVRATFNGKRTYFKPIEYKGRLYVPLVKDKQTGEVKQVEKRGDRLYVAGTDVEVGTKGLKEIHI